MLDINLNRINFNKNRNGETTHKAVSTWISNEIASQIIKLVWQMFHNLSSYDKSLYIELFRTLLHWKPLYSPKLRQVSLIILGGFAIFSSFFNILSDMRIAKARLFHLTCRCALKAKIFQLNSLSELLYVYKIVDYQVIWSMLCNILNIPCMI